LKLEAVNKTAPIEGYDGNTIFTTPSASSTFGYGLIPVRFKIKKGTPFKETTYGARMHSVGVRLGRFQDFTIQDPSVIENWSYGTPELYDEIVRDVLRISSGKRALSYKEAEPWGEGMERLYSQAADDNVQDESTLKRSLLELIREILNGEGRIVYASGVCSDPVAAYDTDKHTWMNP
jgi:hypothetical protein